MKTQLYILAFVLSQTAFCFSQEISKADILKTLSHIQELSRETRQELVHAQSEYQIQGGKLREATESAETWHKAASENARERDVILYLWAIAAGFWVGSLFGGEALRQLPFPYGPIACVAIYLFSGIAAYTLGRFLLASLAHFIP